MGFHSVFKVLMDTSCIIVVKVQEKVNMDDDFYIASWNVLCLIRTGMLQQNFKNVELLLQQSQR